jgi:hypothetical protein
MKGEIEFFRKRFFGGFNRDDVVKYISKLAQERNESRIALERAEKDARNLARMLEAKEKELTLLRAELEELRAAVAVAQQPEEPASALGDVTSQAGDASQQKNSAAPLAQPEAATEASTTADAALTTADAQR